MQITVNGKKIKVKEGQTILEAIPKESAYIPTLCNHPDLAVKANCRVCLVELKGGHLVTACSEKVADGMEIKTDSLAVQKARRTNLELIFAEHLEKCRNCFWDRNCKLQRFSRQYQAPVSRFKDRKGNRHIYEFSGSVLFDQTKCIDCGNCVEVCQRQAVGFYEYKGKGYKESIVPTENKKIDCTACGQCIVHCPVGAIQGASHIPQVEAALRDPDKIVIAQTAPSIRVSIGQEFGLKPGAVATDKMVAAIKKLGFDYVFDTNLGADITTFEEAGECWRCLAKGQMVLTSCCPAWVKFIEFNYPEFIKNISTTRSPQICLGGVVKTYFAKKFKIDPKKIVVVSIMPCTAKKFEAARPELTVNGLKAVDYVITTRGVAKMMRDAKIDLAKIKGRQFDSPLGRSSGAAALYGASGGVMESALRTALDYYVGTKLGKRLEFKQVRGQAGIKKAEINVRGKKIRIAVVNELGNAKKLLDLIKSGKERFHFVEVMACPGGCIGGGGQPVPTNARIRQARADALYVIDKKMKIRMAHENPDLKKIYQEYIGEGSKLAHKLFHTKNYKQKRRGADKKR